MGRHWVSHFVPAGVTKNGSSKTYGTSSNDILISNW